jgi:hypothetical protein
MKKFILSLIASISALLFAAPAALAQSLPTPDLSVWNSAQMKPVQQFANIAVGVIFGLAVVYGVIMVSWYGIKLQGSGSDPIKSQEAKNGLKSTLVGVGITLAATFIIGLVLYVLGVIGIKTS